MNNDPLKILLAALQCVDASQVEFQRDSVTGEPIAKVSLRKDQVEDALRENGRYVREAAMATGIRIDVSLAKNKNA